MSYFVRYYLIDITFTFFIRKKGNQKAPTTASGSIAIDYLHSIHVTPKKPKLAMLKQSAFLYGAPFFTCSLADVVVKTQVVTHLLI